MAAAADGASVWSDDGMTGMRPMGPMTAMGGAMTAPVLRVATGDDVAFLAQVVLLANEERYASREGFDREAFRRGLVDDAADQVAGGPVNSTTYVVESDDQRVGRLRVVRTAAALEIAGLQILPGRQDHGIGTAVVQRVLDEAALTGLPVALEVELDNPGAKRLYLRLGFVDTGVVEAGCRQMIHRAR